MESLHAVGAVRTHTPHEAILSAHVSSPHAGPGKAVPLNAFGLLSEVAAASWIGRFTHCAAIRAWRSVRSCNHRRARDDRPLSAADLAPCSMPLHRDRNGETRQAVGHLVNRLVFCMFAADVGLLPDDMFTRILERARGDPDKFADYASRLLGAMATGGVVGFEPDQ